MINLFLFHWYRNLSVHSTEADLRSTTSRVHKPWSKKKTLKDVKMFMSIHPDISNQRNEHNTQLKLTIELRKKYPECIYTALVNTLLCDPSEGNARYVRTRVVPFLPNKKTISFFTALIPQDAIEKCTSRKLRLELDVTIVMEFQQYSEEDYEFVKRET